MQGKWQLVLAVALFATGLGAGYAAMQWRAGQPAQPPPAEWTVDLTAAGLPADAEPLVFTLSTCPACRKSRTWLAERGIAHRELVLDESEDARRLAEAFGVRVVPAYVVGDQAMAGFDPQRLETFLGRAHGID